MNYTPFGQEWEEEISKLPKDELVKMIRELQTGTTDKKMVAVETFKEAEHCVTGIINDFSEGIITKGETMRLLGEYTGRIMSIFWDNAKKKFNENPELLKS